MTKIRRLVNRQATRQARDGMGSTVADLVSRSECRLTCGSRWRAGVRATRTAKRPAREGLTDHADPCLSRKRGIGFALPVAIPAQTACETRRIDLSLGF
jgi:hypothetical protein